MFPDETEIFQCLYYINVELTVLVNVLLFKQISALTLKKKSLNVSGECRELLLLHIASHHS